MSMQSWTALNQFWTSFLPAYLELVNTIVPGPQSLSYFIPHILLPACLSIPPSILSHHVAATLAMPIILGSTLHAWIVMRGFDVMSIDTLWWTFFFLVFKAPKQDFKRLVDPEENDVADPSDLTGIVEESYPAQFWPRLQWVFALLSNRPLSSWKIGVNSHDANACRPNIKRSRLAFLKGILQVLVPAVAITMPVALQLRAHDAFFSAAGQSLFMPYGFEGDKLPLVVKTIQYLIPKIALRPLTLGLYLYSLLTLLFLPPYLLPVLASFLTASPTARWSPHTWPRPHFGHFSAVLDSGLRGLWGRWWHQRMRHAVSEPGRWLAAKLKLKRAGLARYACICISAFTLSGLTHAGLLPPEPRLAKCYGPWQLRLMVAAFFWVQPVGILLEVSVVEPMISSVFNNVGSDPGSAHSFERPARMLWVLLFMSFSLAFLLQPFIELGYWQLWPPFFLNVDMQHILRRSWVR